MTDSASHDRSDELNSSDDNRDTSPSVANASLPLSNKLILSADELPRRERVFGKWAFAITVVPFLIYWGATSVGSYLERTRKLTPVHGMHNDIIRPALEQISASLREAEATAQRNPAENRELLDWRRKYYLDDLLKFMEDEEGDLEELRELSSKIREADFSNQTTLNVPDSFLESLQRYLRHYIDLRQRDEDNDLDGIRQLHEAFLANEANYPDSVFTQQKLNFFVGNRSWYPMAYTIAAAATLLAVLLAMPGYLKIPFRVNSLAFVVGSVGIVIWVGLWYLDKHFLHVSQMFGSHARAGFNPLAELHDTPEWAYAFLAIRFIGLILLIPIAEEFFTRGFLMRYIDDPDWDEIPMGLATWKGVTGVIAYGALAHTGEALAAVVWFTLMTWMYLKTKNVWDCVVAHGVTNLLLGLFVILTGTWELW